MPVPALARRPAPLTLVLELRAIGLDAWRVRRRRVGKDSRWASDWVARPRFAGARNHHGVAVALRLLKPHGGRFGRGLRHRSAHSTNAGGTSLRTIITRRMRSSRSSVPVPRRAASTVGYRAHAAARSHADP